MMDRETGDASSSAQPLVSCLCVTRRRPHHLKRAIRCFLSQTYPHKEMIVVHPRNDTATLECLQSFNDERIRSFALSRADASLGDLRNFSIDRASGEYLCCWDDDDWYGADRILRQYEAVKRSGKSATALTNLLLYDSGQQKAYLSQPRVWENSVFFEKREMLARSITYPSLNQGEDSHFVTAMIAANLMYPFNDPTLYVYHGTGSNTVGAAHYGIFLAHATALDEYQTSVVRRCIDMELPPEAAYEEMQSRRFRAPLAYISPREVSEKLREIEIVKAWRRAAVEAGTLTAS